MLAALLAATEESAEVINPVVPELAEMVWAAVFFFGLWILMKYVLLPPVQSARRDREARVVADLEAAEAARTDAEAVRRDYDATLAEARVEAASVLEAARAAGDARRAELVGAAEAEAASARDGVMARVAEQRQAVMAQLQPEVGSVGVDAASRVVGRRLGVAENQAIIDELVSGTK